jgi:hypothetical protein
MTNLTVLDFSGKNIRFERRGDRIWVSLTDMAKVTEKSVQDWISQKSVINYLENLEILEEQELRKYAYTLGLDNFIEAFAIFSSITNAEKARKENTEQEGMIYIVSNGSKYYKLGFSKNVKQRIKSLQTANGKSLTLVKTFLGNIESEQKLHKLLKSFNTTGEWYQKSILGIVTQELIDSLNEHENNLKKVNDCFPLVINCIPDESSKLTDTWVNVEVAVDFALWCYGRVGSELSKWVIRQVVQLESPATIAYPDAKLPENPNTALVLTD